MHFESKANRATSSLSTEQQPTIKAISAFGRLEPEGQVIKVSAPGLGEGKRVEKLLVKQGDKVNSGQLIALLDTEKRLLTDVQHAQRQVAIDQARLNKVQAGESQNAINAQKKVISRLEAELQGDIQTQKANIVRIQAELQNAIAEYQRYNFLFQQGAISASVSDSKELIKKTFQAQLNQEKAALNKTIQTYQKQIDEAKQTLNKIAEVRPVDVRLVESELLAAKAAVQQTQARLETAYVKAPQEGQILKIYTHPGEVIGSGGIVDMGQTNQMYVVAEVYETDISRVILGQKATITSPSFQGKLTGVVDNIGLQILKRDVLDTDPTADVDARVVEVKIRLNLKDSKQVAGLTNLQVNVLISPSQI